MWDVVDYVDLVLPKVSPSLFLLDRLAIACR